jgi:hypothetical protein
LVLLPLPLLLVLEPHLDSNQHLPAVMGGMKADLQIPPYRQNECYA